ncbi:MAG: glutamate 5-kinase [Saccharothrix sp.]|nr:glutamate 5-kinase [Saccharothrix sp.]
MLPNNSGRRVVVKIGTTSLLTGGRPDLAKVDRLAEAAVRGVEAGFAPVLVTSGAIALGRARHDGLSGGDPVTRQVAAAVGQGELYATIAARFAARGLTTGQLLLTPRDMIGPPEPTGEFRRALDAMRALGVVPVANENDVLGVRNNDILAAVLTGYLGAELLLLLTNVDGFYDGGARVREARLTSALEAAARDSDGAGGTGGMLVKLCACRIATHAGARVVIAGTADPGVLVGAALGEDVGTTFRPPPAREDRPDLGRLWRAFHRPPTATITCTQDAVTAVDTAAPVRHGQVKAIEGTFRAGDVVDLVASGSALVARGRVACDSALVGVGHPPDAVLLPGADYVKIMEDR